MTLGFLLSPCFGAEKKPTLSLKGGFYSPSSSTFNNEAVPSTNRELKDIASYLMASGFSPNYDELEKMKGNATFGGEIELFFLRRFSITLGAEYWKSTSSASLEASGHVEGSLYGANLNIDFKASLMPITCTLRMRFPYKKLRTYAGGGIGLYMGQVELQEDYNHTKDGDSVRTSEISEEARGSSMIPHVNGGFDLNITETLSLGIDVRYLFGKIKSFEIKESSDKSRVKSQLTFVDENGLEKAFQWELDGINLGIFLRIKLY